MSNLRETINDLAHDLYQAEMIDTITLRDLTEKSLPELNEYTGQEIQVLRRDQHLSQAAFAKYLNISPAMIKSLELGQRKAQGAILRLLNIVERRGLSGLA
ncbi:MAG: helix-turn-helix domain-containing protein [Gammaproteobacteria bacterium]|nr:helix-turn-helix domain-containing protein [Gammaproteobacteria bacterium]